jgi:thiamine biosynthesis protein ThiS
MIKVNGEKLKHTAGMTVTDILKAKQFNFPLLIIKIDGIYVPRDQYDQREVPDKAEVEVIHLISGG